MQCVECHSQPVEFVEQTEEATTILRCTACGCEWEHGPSPEVLKAGNTGAEREHCPVCPAVFSDPNAPIVVLGSPNPTNHRCDQTGSFKAGIRYGASPAALDARLAEIDDAALNSWPAVRKMKHERLGGA